MTPDLFDYPTSPGSKEPTTSRDAAKAVENDAALIRNQVIGALERAGAIGLTADETARLLRRDRLAVRPRFSELKADGKIVRTGARRANESGLKAAVWRIKRGDE